jgi:hypothetical protein
MLSEHDLRTTLAEALHEQADPVTGDGIDTAGIFARAARRRRHRRTAVRVTSVLAAAALLAGAWALHPWPARSPGSPAPGHQPPGLLLAATVVRPQPARAADAGLPPYYVIADHNRPVAEIRRSATGKLLSRVPLPPGTDPKVSQIAAGRPGTFVLALSSFPRTRFYLLHVPAHGHRARLALLPVPPLPAEDFVTALAVSPDGRMLAVALQLSGGQHGAVQVMQLVTGAVRTWTTARNGGPTALSWAGHELGFFWQDDKPAATSAAGLWTLDTTAPGRNLMSGRRILPALVGSDDVQTALLGPGGRTAIASVTYDGTAHVGAGTVVGGIVEVSAETGHPLRTLLAEHAAYSPDPGPDHPGWYVTSCELPAIDGSGAHLLVSCHRFGRLDHARFTPLPGSSPQTAVAAAW